MFIVYRSSNFYIPKEPTEPANSSVNLISQTGNHNVKALNEEYQDQNLKTNKKKQKLNSPIS